MKSVYLDNAATSFPKPAGVYEAMLEFGTRLGASPGRGGYAPALEAARLVTQCRQRIAKLFNTPAADHIVFTLNATDALNLAIKGLMQPDKANHIILTDLEHNSVLRPVHALVNGGIATATYIRCDPATGMIDPDDVRNALTSDTRVIVLIHGSNVSGTIMPVSAVGRIAREACVPLLVDAAQTAGHFPIDVQAMGIDLLACPGHKGLLGPLGTGVLYIRPGMETRLRTVREGGTGSVSDRDVQPEMMPDKFESGSHNTIGIVGLSEGVKWILDRGVDQLWQHEQTLITRLLGCASSGGLPGLHLVGPTVAAQRCGVFSIRIDGLEPNEFSSILEDRYGLLTRAGLHCAPRAHRTFGTGQHGGTVRLSLGAFNTVEDVDAVCEALGAISTTWSAPVSSSVS